jgi:hypothetical protein
MRDGSQNEAAAEWADRKRIESLPSEPILPESQLCTAAICEFAWAVHSLRFREIKIPDRDLLIG